MGLVRIDFNAPEPVKAHLVEMCEAFGKYGRKATQTELIIKLIEEKYEQYVSVSKKV